MVRKIGSHAMMWPVIIIHGIESIGAHIPVSNKMLGDLLWSLPALIQVDPSFHRLATPGRAMETIEEIIQRRLQRIDQHNKALSEKGPIIREGFHVSEPQVAIREALVRSLMKFMQGNTHTSIKDEDLETPRNVRGKDSNVTVEITQAISLTTRGGTGEPPKLKRPSSFDKGKGKAPTFLQAQVRGKEGTDQGPSSRLFHMSGDHEPELDDQVLRNTKSNRFAMNLL